jgi:S-methyl-1-thioxylulose 5-phosphate methylthiotransferase
VIRSRNFRWEEIPTQEYKAEGTHFRGITRQVLLGEGEGEGDLAFITRYFEMEPGGYSSLERHQHPHSVVVLRGTGKVILGDAVHDLAPFDCVYVAPGCLHQFHASGPEPLGFLCIVDRERDLPELPADEEVAALQARPEVGEWVRG